MDEYNPYQMPRPQQPPQQPYQPTYQQQQAPPPPGAQIPAQPPEAAAIDRNARQWAMFCHLAGLAVLLPIALGLGGVIATLILWQIKKEEFPFVDEQGKEALNFQISIVIYSLVSALLICAAGIGIIFLVAVGLFNIICVVIAAVGANEGRHYRYPLCIRFIK